MSEDPNNTAVTTTMNCHVHVNVNVNAISVVNGSHGGTKDEWTKGSAKLEKLQSSTDLRRQYKVYFSLFLRMLCILVTYTF